MTASTSRDQQRLQETEAMGTASSPARLAGRKRSLMSATLELLNGIVKRARTAVQFVARTTTRADDREPGEPLPEAAEEGGRSQQARGVAEGEELEVTGSGELMTADLATELLELVLAVGARVTKVKLSTMGVGKDAALVLAKGLQNISKTLAVVGLSDILAGLPEDEARQVLRIISGALKTCKLMHLDLSGNALGEKGIRACADALLGQTLQGLRLQNIGCCVDACRAVAELVEDASDLRQLHLFNNKSADGGAVHIASLLARAPLMEDFSMASSGVGPGGGIVLLQALSKGSSLVKLDISCNLMWEDIAPELAACLSRHPNLRVLNLSDTFLTDAGVITVCIALESACPGLEELHLALNEITSKGAKAVGRAVAAKPQLMRLMLRENELEDEGAEEIYNALGACLKLKELDLGYNKIRNKGALAAAWAVASKVGFELLALDGNQISKAGVDEVTQHLKRAFPGASVLGPMDANESGASVLDPKDANEPGTSVLDPKDANQPGTSVLDPKDANQPGTSVLGPMNRNDPPSAMTTLPPAMTTVDRGRTTKKARRAEALSAAAKAAGPSN